MIDEYPMACRLFLAELATYSDLLPSKLTDEILVEYSDKKILSIVDRLEEKSFNQINEGIGLLIVGITAWISYAKRKAEKARESMVSSQNKMCDHLIGKEKADCIKNNTKNANEKKLSIMKKYMKDCSKLKDPEKCKYMMNTEIMKMKRKISL